MAKSGKTKIGRLRVERVADVPLREVSGICLRRGRNRKMSLVAIGDHAAHLAWTSLPGKKNPQTRLAHRRPHTTLGIQAAQA